MDKYNVEKAIIVPINEPPMYFEDCDKTNEWLGNLMNSSNERFISFADIVPSGYFHESSPWYLKNAIEKFELKGLKIHPVNLGIPIDSLDMVPVIRTACDHKVPIMIHSYPSAYTDYNLCTPDHIHNMTRLFPDGKFIISHMGGMRWNDVLAGSEYVDISTFLPEFVQIYGIDMANRILRKIGVKRLIFATDYPQVIGVETENIYATYCDILNQMDFSDQEIEMIAYKNISDILGI